MSPRKKKIEQEYSVGINVLDQFLSTNDDNNADGLQTLAITDIQINKAQPRRYFNAESLEQLAASIRKEGILQPLIVRPLEPNRYELVAGERRYRAAQIVGLEEVPVIIRELSEMQAFEIALMENLSREDLNPVEETEGLLDLLSLKLDCTRQEVTSLIQTGGHSERESAKAIAATPEWRIVQETFSAIGRFTPNSFRAHRLPLLKLPEDVLEALRAGDIEYSKATRVARIKNDAVRQEFLQRVINENLSRADINAFLAAMQSSAKKETSTAWVNRIGTVYRKAQQMKRLAPDKQKQVMHLLAQLEDIFAE